MSFPFFFFFSKVRLPNRMAGAAVALLTLVITGLCGAAETPFGPSGKYSLQLPKGWTAKPGNNNSVIGSAPGEAVVYSASVRPNAQSPQEVMERDIATFEKKPGYKLIEKGPVKNDAERKAQAIRYQVNRDSSPEAHVEYYLQLAEKEVVMLSFQLPDFSSKSAKSDIEAICGSVKVAAASTAPGDSWLKSDAPSASSPRTSTDAGTMSGTPTTFATNCSVVLPAGWTANASGKYLQGKGPGGATIDGFSTQTPMSVDDALAQHLSVFEKMPNYEMVDVDGVSTKAGAEGKLAYYRYNGKSGPVTEIGVIIKVAKTQMVTLRFLAPSASKKLDPAFESGVEAIFSSLKISG